LKFAKLVLILVASACAGTGATYRSGVGDKFLEHPPYYAGNAAPTGARIVYVPVHFQRGASQSPVFDPASGSGSPVAALLADMNGSLDSLGAAAQLVKASRAPVGTMPDVYFGCALDATNDCVERGDSVLGRRGTTMHLALRRPSPEWIAEAQRIMDSAGATHVLLVTLEVGQYWLRQNGLLGRKSVELGTAHTISAPWLTSLETPVSVLQLTGVLVGRDGRGVRIGAEGFMAKRTELIASAMGAQRLLRDQDVEQARTARRDELPGQPLAWRVALCNLIAGVGAGPTCR
jgi:hypothetical protein